MEKLSLNLKKNKYWKLIAFVLCYYNKCFMDPNYNIYKYLSIAFYDPDLTKIIKKENFL
jgi:hypothetical protein